MPDGDWGVVADFGRSFLPRRTSRLAATSDQTRWKKGPRGDVERMYVPWRFAFQGKSSPAGHHPLPQTELQTIRIHFARDVARYVQESRWHGSQKLTSQQDGSLIAEFSLPDTQEIKRWIMSFGVNATVLEPQELVEEISNDLRKMLARYIEFDATVNPRS